MLALCSRRRRAAAAAAFVLCGSAAAPAHIDLLEPEARAHGTAARGDTQLDENSNLKSGPCGQVTSGRTERVATYAPGQTITVRVREENAHVSYLRVALALDGESFPLRSSVPAAPETQEQARAAEEALGDFGLLAVVRENNDTAGFVHELEVTLPDSPCQRCTLQVLQFMYDDPAAPYYFQCADLVLTDGGSAADAGAAPGPDPAAAPSAVGDGTAEGEPPGSRPGAGAPAALGAGGSSAIAAAPAARSPEPSSAARASETRPEPAAGAAPGPAGGSGCGLAARSSASGPFVLGALALAFSFGRRRVRPLAIRDELGRRPFAPAR